MLDAAEELKPDTIAPAAVTKPGFWRDKSVTILIPALDERRNLEELLPIIFETVDGLKLGIKLTVKVIDDGSSDGTCELLADFAKDKDERVEFVKLRTNYGKSLALNIGFRSTTSDYVITMDADLQDDPADIVKFLSKLEEGYDLVCGNRVGRRNDTSFRKLGSRVYNWALKKSSNLELSDFNCGFKAYSRPLFEALVLYGHYHRFVPYLAHSAGFSVAEVDVINNPRVHGESKFRAFRYQGFFDLLSITFLNKYGLNPLHFFGKVAVAIILPSLLILMFFVASQMLFLAGFGDQFMVQNRPLILFCITGVLFGSLFLMTGFVCDFFLHHFIRDRMSSIVSIAVQDQSDRSRG